MKLSPPSLSPHTLVPLASLKKLLSPGLVSAAFTQSYGGTVGPCWTITLPSFAFPTSTSCLHISGSISQGHFLLEFN
jgi:hypothetical protein